jgi:hypothetical protein
MSIRNVCLDALYISLVLEDTKELALETGGRNAHDLVASPKPVL